MNASKLYIKKNEIVNKFLLAGDCGPFTKNKERIQKFKETGNTSYMTKNELDKACFEHDMVYGDFLDLARRTASDNVLRDKALNIAKNPKYDVYQRGLASMVYKFFDKKSKGGGVANNEIKQNVQLAKELHEPISRNYKKTQFILYLKIISGVLV